MRDLCVLLALLAWAAGQACPAGDRECAAAAIAEAEAGCPPLVKPTDIHFMVINLDRSKGRLARMREAFANNSLPDFERVPGVEVKESLLGTAAYPVPRLTPYLKIADYGTCLAHYAAWQAVYTGKHRWVIILEDDADFVPGVNLLDFPKVPKDTDLVLLRASTVVESHAVCNATSIRRATWGYGMVGYLTSRAGAHRLIKAAAKGFNSPLDGHVWHHNNVLYSTATNYIDHGPCANPCPSSIRTFLNGEVSVEPD
eukprot:m.6347 g.6347  ORF g.6347 m.6347 type:complete len:256 (-) comp2091_c0_seq1:126-893(-)